MDHAACHATCLRTRKQQLFKVIERLGLSTTKHRNSSHRNQVISHITKEDLELIMNHMAVPVFRVRSKTRAVPIFTLGKRW